MINTIYNQLIKLTIRFFKGFIVVVVILIAAICYFGFLSNKISEVRQFKVFDYATKERELQERKDYLDDLKVVETNYKKWKGADLAKIDQVLPSSEDFPGLFAQYEQMITDAGYTLSDLSLYKTSELTGNTSQGGTSLAISSSVKTVNIQMGLASPEGYGYDNFKTLLNTIESNIRLTDVISLSFSPDQTGYRLNLKTYYLPSS